MGIGFIASLANLKAAQLITTLVGAVSSVAFCIHVLDHLPSRDFRPYAVGKSISKQMALPAGSKADVYQNTFYYKNKATGEIEEFDENSIPWEDQNFEFVDRKTELMEKGDEAKITDFSIVDGDGYNMTEEVLNDPAPVLLVISYNVGKAKTSNMKELSDAIASVYKKGGSVIGLSASSPEMLQTFREKNKLDIPFYACDEITLKTMVRSNPGLVLLRDGTVIGKWHINDVADLTGLDLN